MSIKVSVIIPVYNGEKFLRRAIDSVVNQTYSDRYEVLLIDDGSTDGTAEICKEYTEKYHFIHYHYHDNMGIAQTREKAVELARGEYLGWLDQDDYVSPDLLKITMQKIEETGADVCVFTWRDFYSDGKTADHLMQNRSLDEWQKQVLMGNVSATWSYICKRELWDNEKMPWQVWRNADDAYITLILFFKAKKIVSVSQTLYYYDQGNPFSITSSYSGMKLMGIGYVTYQRFKFSLEFYPNLADQVGNYSLRMLTRAYSVSTYLKDLDEEKRELLRTYILDVAKQLKHQSFRNKYRVFFIRHRWDWAMEIVGKMSMDKKNRQNKRIKS